MRALLLAGAALLLPAQAQSRVQSFTLPNGLRVLHLEDHERPLVHALLSVNLDPADLPPDRQGLPLLLMRMFDHSDAADLKAEDLPRLLEESGIRWESTTQGQALEWRLVARSRDQDRAMGLLADRLQRTVFDPAVLEVQRLACWHETNRPEDSPHAQLRQALRQSSSNRPTLTSLSSISWEELLAFRARALRPDRTVLVLHGDLGLEQAKRLVLLSLGTWTKPALAGRSELSASKRPAPSLLPALTAMPPSSPSRVSAPGTDLRVQALAPRPDGLSPELAWLIPRLVVGQSSLAPIHLEAEPEGLMATLDAEPGSTVEGSLSQLTGALAAMARRLFTQTDLDQARSAWLKGRSLDSLHPEAQMETALAEARTLAPRLDRMATVTLEELNAGLRRWLDPSNLRCGAAGEPDALKARPKP